MKLTADQLLVFDWIAGSTYNCRLTHLKLSEASFFARFLWLDAATRLCYVNYSSYRVNAFRVQVGNGLENVFFLPFRWFQSSLTYHDRCGPHWRLRSYLSQASEGYELKDEGLLGSYALCIKTPILSVSMSL